MGVDPNTGRNQKHWKEYHGAQERRLRFPLVHQPSRSLAAQHNSTAVGSWGSSIIAYDPSTMIGLLPVVRRQLPFQWRTRTCVAEMQAIQDLCGSDVGRRCPRRWAVLQEEKIDPLGGCLPVLGPDAGHLSLYGCTPGSMEKCMGAAAQWITRPQPFGSSGL